MKETRECAIANGYEAALNSAGVAKYIRSTTVSRQSETESDFSESFENVFQSNYEGAVVGMRNYNEQKSIDSLGDVLIEICADYAILVYDSKPDPGFQFEVNGLMPAYRNGDEVSFTVRGSEGYLYAFMLEGDSVFRFYPSSAEPEIRLERNNKKQFPIPKYQQEYRVFNDAPDATKSLVLLFSKSSLDLPKIKTKSQLLFWMNGIEPEKKNVFIHPFAMSD